MQIFKHSPGLAKNLMVYAFVAATILPIFEFLKDMGYGTAFLQQSWATNSNMAAAELMKKPTTWQKRSRTTRLAMQSTTAPLRSASA